MSIICSYLIRLNCSVFPSSVSGSARDKWVPITMAWRVLRLRMEERPPDMEDSCQDIE